MVKVIARFVLSCYKHHDARAHSEFSLMEDKTGFYF